MASGSRAMEEAKETTQTQGMARNGKLTLENWYRWMAVTTSGLRIVERKDA
jgi:hypothetical protein